MDINKLKKNQLWSIVKEFPDHTITNYQSARNPEMIEFLKTKHKKLVGGKFDIQKLITKAFPNTEFHLPGYSFCGPGTKLDKRLKNFDKETGVYDSIVTPPINALDKGCLEHDIGYTKHKETKDRHDDDRALIKIATDVMKNNSSTFREKFEAGLTKHLLQAKVAFGGGNCTCGCAKSRAYDSLMTEMS
jgi:hypothetical protein